MTEKEIGELQERLQNLYDKLHSIIVEEEKELESWHLGVETWITCPEYNLGYVKYKDNWHISVLESREVDGVKEERVKPLDKASREIRCSAIKYLPALREEVFKEANSLVRKLERVVNGNEEEDRDNDYTKTAHTQTPHRTPTFRTPHVSRRKKRIRCRQTSRNFCSCKRLQRRRETQSL